jgi:hypothetical protein
MNLTEYKTTKEKVRAIIKEYPHTKDSDIDLVIVYYNTVSKLMMSETSFNRVMSLIESKELPHISTIERARRQLNEKEPNTRGLSYKGRKENEQVIKENINII